MKTTTTKEIRKAMRSMNTGDTIVIDGWGQIFKGGNNYAIGPLPEKDDTDVYSDYDAWSYGWKESWILDNIKKELNIA